MIKSENGRVHISGQVDDVAADIGMLLRTLLEHGEDTLEMLIKAMAPMFDEDSFIEEETRTKFKASIAAAMHMGKSCGMDIH